MRVIVGVGVGVDVAVDVTPGVVVEVGVFVDSSEWGYDENDKYRVKWDVEDVSFVWDDFYKRVLK